MNKEKILYDFLLPQVWKYFENNLLNLFNPSLGTKCYEIQLQNNILKETNLTKTIKLKKEAIPTTFLAEFLLTSKISKIILRSDRYAPQLLKLEYSTTSTDNSAFKMLNVITTSTTAATAANATFPGKVLLLEKGKPLTIDLSAKNLHAKYLRLKVLKGRAKSTKESTQDGMCVIHQFACYGAPQLSIQNLQSIPLDTVWNLLQNLVKEIKSSSSSIGSIIGNAANLTTKPTTSTANEGGPTFQIIEDEDDSGTDAAAVNNRKSNATTSANSAQPGTKQQEQPTTSVDGASTSTSAGAAFKSVPVFATGTKPVIMSKL